MGPPWRIDPTTDRIMSERSCGPDTLLRMRNMFHTQKKPLKIQNWAYTYRIELMSSVWVARFGPGMSTNASECWRTNSVLCVWPAYSAYGYRMSNCGYDEHTPIIRKLYVKYVTQSSGIRQDVHICCRYARHTFEVRYLYAINTLAVRYIFMPTYGNVCPPYLTYE